MSQVFFGISAENMARKLGESLAQDSPRDPFLSIDILVPNPYLGKWLRLQLARQLNVVFNVRFLSFEQAIWDLLRELDTRPQPPEALSGELYRFLVLSVLLEYRGKELDGLRAYLGHADKDSVPWWRRAWNVSDRMAGLIRDYEYHRREAFIGPWLGHHPAKPTFTSHDQQLERAQGTLFHEIIREPDGRRAFLNKSAGHNFKTLPQYAGELMEEVKPPRPAEPLRRVTLFGITQMSELHVRALAWLSGYFDLQCYFLSPFTPLLDDAQPERLRSTLDDLRADYAREDALGLVRRWKRAGFESLGRLQDLVTPLGPIPWNVVDEPPRVPQVSTVLTSLQAALLERPTEKKLPQDTSLQVVGCPGIRREVETVYDSIVHNLHADKDLRLTDIAVLVTDMETYRPALKARFEREDKIGYSLIDHSAAGVSLWGQALLNMLDLAQENFSRSQVFEVLLNPCVLARLGVDRAKASVWLHWAEELGVYHGWDADERKERGQVAEARFAWRQALQRLRLGRYMDADADAGDGSVRFGELVPHLDIHSGDREQLDAFCRAVEGLLPVLIRLRSARENGRWWAEKIRFLSRTFLAIPEDRPSEARVREELLSSLEHLELWDALHGKNSEKAAIPLALVREFVNSGIQGISASQGQPLVAGVTISALQPMRPVPFKIIYVLGMNETLFPGRNALSSLDLRSHAPREPGDILPAEQNLLLLLEVVLSARGKLYFFYNNRDLQKDEELLPAMPLAQLRRFLSESIVKEEFQFIADVPLHSHGNVFHPRPQRAFEDVLQTRDAYPRGMAILQEITNGNLKLDPKQLADLEQWRGTHRPQFAMPSTADAPTSSKPVTIRLKDLRDFLFNPALAMIRRRLRIEEDREEEEGRDDEPFVSAFFPRHNMLQHALREAIRRHLAGTLPNDVAAWSEFVDPAFLDAQLRCQAPGGAFGELDCAELREEFRARVEGDEKSQGLKAFLEARSAESFQGPILLGESNTPVGAKVHLPALRLQIPTAGPANEFHEACLIGHCEFAWKSDESLELLFYSYAKEAPKDPLSKSLLDPLLFCLALLALDPADTGELPHCARDLVNRRWSFHFLHGKGLKTWTVEPGAISPTEARMYLTDLTAAFEKGDARELLPLAPIAYKTDLYQAAIGSAESQLSEAEFQSELREAIEASRDSPMESNWDDPLLQIVNADVPEDALARCRRRYEPLVRGLTAVKVVAPKKPRKSRKK